MKHPLSLLVTSLLFAACGASRSASAPAMAPTPTPAADASVAASPPPDPRREAVLAAWRAANPDPNPNAAPALVGDPLDYPDDGVTARVAAVVAAGGEAMLVVTSVPYAEGQQASASLALTGLPAEVIAGLSVRDINGDHKNDIAVFLRREYELDTYAPLQRFAHFYTLVTTPELELRPLVRAEVELLGVRDDAALAAAIPTLGRYEAPAAGMSPARFIARLRYATPTEFRQAVAAAGLRLCTDLPDRTGTRRKRCAPYLAARLTDAMIAGRIRADLRPFVDVLAYDANELTFPSCQRHGAELRCNANIGGPEGLDWAVVGDGAAMRIVEISPWAESS